MKIFNETDIIKYAKKKNMISSKLNEEGCVAFREVAKECYDRLVDEKLIMSNLDSWHLLK